MPDVMIIKLDTLAVPAQHAMSAKTRVELIFPSLSLEKKGGKISSNSYLLEDGSFGRMGREVSAFIIITGKHASSVLVYHHLSVVTLVQRSIAMAAVAILFSYWVDASMTSNFDIRRQILTLGVKMANMRPFHFEHF